MNWGWIPTSASLDDINCLRAASFGRFSTYTATFAWSQDSAACVSAGAAWIVAPRLYPSQSGAFCTGTMAATAGGGAMWKPAVLFCASAQLSFPIGSLQPLCFTQLQHQFCWPGQRAAEGGAGTALGPCPRQALPHGSGKLNGV